MAEPECLTDNYPVAKHVQSEPVPTWRFLAPKWRHVRPGAPLREIVGKVGVPIDSQDPDRPHKGQQPWNRPTSMWDDADVVLGRLGIAASGGIPVWLFGSGNVGPDWDWQIFLAVSPTDPAGINRSGKPNQDVESTVQSRHGFGDDIEYVGPDGRVVKTDSTIGISARKITIPVDAAGRPSPLVELEVCADRTFQSDLPGWIPPMGKEVRVYGHWIEDMSHDFKTEIHPVQWLTWENYRAAGDVFQEVVYRVTILTDVSGRFPQEAVDAHITYTVASILGKQTLPQGKALYSEINHETSVRSEKYVRKAAECPRVGNAFEFTCSVGPWTGTKASNCNTTERDGNSGGYWDGFLWFRLKDDPGVAPPPPGPKKPAKPKIEVKFSDVSSTDAGETQIVIRIKGSTRIETFDPARDKLEWKLYKDQASFALQATGLEFEEEVTIPLDESIPRMAVEEKPSEWLPSSESGDRDTMLLAVTATRDGVSDSTAEWFSIPNRDVAIVEEWTLGETVPAGGQAGSATWRLRLTTEAPSETATVRWSLYGQGGVPLDVAASGEAVVSYSPEVLGSYAFVARVEVFEGNSRLAVGRKVVKIPILTLTLDLAASGAQAAQVIARPSNAIGNMNYSWTVTVGAFAGGAWRADAGQVTLEPGDGAGGYAVLLEASDSIGQMAYAARSVSPDDFAALGVMGTMTNADYRAASREQSLLAMREMNRLLRADVDIMEQVRDMVSSASSEIRLNPEKFFEPAPQSFGAQTLGLVQAEKALLQTLLTTLMRPAPSDPCRVIFDNTNTRDVLDGGSSPLFTVTAANAERLCQIDTYHWNHGMGQKPGSIGLRDASGTILGPWPAVGSTGQGGAPNVNWTATPSAPVTLQPGTYTVVDSDPATWSQNAQSGGHGFAKVWIE